MTDPTTQIGTMATDAKDLFIEAVERTPAERWDEPSNLEGWSVRDLMAHGTGSAAKIVTLVEDGEVWGRSEPADWVCENPAARLRELAARLQEALPGADLDACRRTCCGGQADSDQPNPCPKARRQLPGFWPTSGARFEPVSASDLRSR